MKNINKFTIFIFIISLIIVSGAVSVVMNSCTEFEFTRFAMDTGDTENISREFDGQGDPVISPEPEEYSKSTRTSNKNQNNARLITPLDFVSGSSPKLAVTHEKAYTIMIYMNGSDLESKYESATEDILEMFDSEFDSRNINLIIFTGGTNKWHTKGIPNNINAIFRAEPSSRELIKLAEVGKDSMGNPEVLAGFINFCHAFFPAENYGLIFWNHGGGSITGYGSDERYERNPDRAMMRLSEIDSAFASTDLIKNNKIFEFVGFDTCLMATLEMACIAGKYAEYMIASEELEPGQGWDYYFLGEITPDMSGYEIGVWIIDYYAEYYRYSADEEIATLSLTDLSKVQALADAFEKLALASANALSEGEYNFISKARSKSRMFGSYEEHGGGTDMIDAAHLAESLANLLPDESAAMLDALDQAVPYKHDNHTENLGGLSIYFPFTNKQDIDYYLSIYKTMNQLPNYTGFIEEFSNILRSSPKGNYRSVGKITPVRSQNGDCSIAVTSEQLENLAEVYLTVWEKIKMGEEDGEKYIQVGKSSKADIKEDGSITINFDRTWTTLNDRRVCLYEIARKGGRVRYAIPARLNGDDVDLIAIYNREYPDGKIIGAVPVDENGEGGGYDTLNKKLIAIKDGDTLEILYYSTADLFDKAAGSLWYESDEFIVDGELELRKDINQDRTREYYYGITLSDTQKNDYHTGFGIILK